MGKTKYGPAKATLFHPGQSWPFWTGDIYYRRSRITRITNQPTLAQTLPRLHWLRLVQPPGLCRGAAC